MAAIAVVAADAARRQTPRRARAAAPPTRTIRTRAMPPMAKPPVNAITLPLDPARFDGMQITDERYKANGRGFVPSTGRRRPRRRWRARRARTAAARTPTRPPAQILIDRTTALAARPITSTPYSHRNATVSPDGKWIVFAADAELRPDTERRAERDEIAKLGTDAERDRGDARAYCSRICS